MTDDAVEAELDAAAEALADARVLGDGGGSDAAVANRLYYACFHAARAALYEHGEVAGSHAGVISRFGEIVISEGRLDSKHGRALNELYQRREEADYSPAKADIDVGESFDDAEAFVNAVRGLFGTDRED